MKKLLLIGLGVILSPFIIAGTILSYIALMLPSEKEIKGCIITTMYGVELCSTSKSYVPLSKISPFLIKAVVSTEDGSFYTHQGFDINEIKKSFEKNMEKGEFARGGSTITQQLAKNMFLSKEKSLMRKGKEALITLRLEALLTKREILEKYLNVVEFGDKTFGIKAAAQKYFKKTPAQLNIAESAFLTFLLPSPKKYAISFLKGSLSPFSEKRMKEIVSRLHQFREISSEDYQRGLRELAAFPGANRLKIDLSLDTDTGPVEGDEEEYNQDGYVQEEPPANTIEQELSNSDDGMSEGEEVGEPLESDGELGEGEVGPTEE